jgi:hypothetical protein
MNTDEKVLVEPFVSAEEAADFIGIKRRFLLTLARRGIAGAYSLGAGELRRTWVFRLSELASANARNANPKGAEIVRSSGLGSPR